jgi:hypothetical protein
MNKDTQQLLKNFPDLYVTRTRRHYRIVNPKTGDFVVASCTPSDRRAVHNLRSDLRRLHAGWGYLARNRFSTINL